MKYGHSDGNHGIYWDSIEWNMDIMPWESWDRENNTGLILNKTWTGWDRQRHSEVRGQTGADI